MGRKIQVNGSPRLVVGVLGPGGCDLTPEAEVWLPVALDRVDVRYLSGQYLRLVGRLRDGVSPGAAKQDLLAVTAGISADGLTKYPGFEVYPVSVHDDVVGASKKPLALLMAVAILVESAILTLAALSLGLFLAQAGLQFLLSFDLGIPRLDQVRIDGAVLTFGILAVLVTTGLAAGWPAVRSTRLPLGRSLGGRGSSAGRSGRRARHLLVVSQVALSCMLLVGAGLLARTLYGLLSVDPGFRSRGVAPERPERPRVRLEGRRGPIAGRAASPARRELGRRRLSPHSRLPAAARATDGRPGRANGPAGRGGEPVLAEVLWPGEDAIGKRFKLARVPTAATPWRTVVGVVGDVRQQALGAAASRTAYFPLLQEPSWASGWDRVFVVRTSLGLAALERRARQIILEMDPAQPIFAVRRMEDLVVGSVARERSSAWLTGLFAALALALSAVGLYGTIAYGVAQRRREIGIRMVLAARPGDVLEAFLREGMGLAAAGLLLGLAGSLAAARAWRACSTASAPSTPRRSAPPRW